MNEKEKLQDGLVFVSADNTDEFVIVNFATWVSLIRGIMIFMAEKVKKRRRK